RVHVQADSSPALVAVSAAPAGDVEGDRDDVTLLDEQYVPPDLEDFAGDFVSEDQSGRRGGSPADHVLVGAADVGRDNLEDHAMLDLLLQRRVVQLGEIDRLNFDDAGLDVRHATIVCHDRPPRG